jgi:DNA anti-recombination protein RmuC
MLAITSAKVNNTFFIVLFFVPTDVFFQLIIDADQRLNNKKGAVEK